MRKIFIALISLLSVFSIYAQSSTPEARSLVIKTTDGQNIRFNLADIEELTFDNNPAESTILTRFLNLSPEFISISGLEENQPLEAGSQGVLTLTPGPILGSEFQDYHFEHLHVQVNETIIVPQIPEGVSSVSQIQVPFTVPEGECDIVVCYSIQQQMSDNGFTMTLEPNPHVKLFGVSPDCRYKYFDAYLLVDDAFVITGAEFKMGNGEWMSVNDTFGCSLYSDYSVPNVYHVCIRPDYEDVTGNVELRVSGEQHQRYGITWTNAGSTYLDLENSILPSDAIDGEVVTGVIYVNDDYYLNGASASVEIPVETLYGSYVRFTMPTSDVEITLDIREKVPVTCTGGAHVAEARIYDAPDIYYGRPVSNGIPGEEVYIIATAESGFKPVTAHTDAGGTFSFSHYGLDMFVCPVTIPEDATSLSVSIDCAQAWTVTSAQEVAFDNGQIYAEGETVSFAMRVPVGKQIESVTAVTASGQELELTLDIPYASFVMPAEDVTVIVTYSDLSGGDMVSVIAYYDSDQYSVRSSTNYDWDFEEGFNIEKGATFYLSVYDDYGCNFYVGVKTGESLVIYPAVEDEESGEYTFGKALVASDNMVIKVGPTESSVTF